METENERRARLAALAAKRHVVRRSRRLHAFLKRWARRNWPEEITLTSREA